MSVVVIGTIYVDIKGYPSSVFDPRGRNAGSICEFHGGVGRNIAEDLGNAGLAPVFVSLVDDNSRGEEVINRLADHNVDVSFIKRANGGMGTWLAIFDNDGDVYANISTRPDFTSVTDILRNGQDELFSQADGILFEIDMGRDIADCVFELAEQYDKKVYGVVSNVNIALEMKEYILKTDCFICNQQEAGIFFNKELADLPAEEMLDLLPDMIAGTGIRRMIVTLGERGSVYADQSGKCGVCPALSVAVKDTTGAGDAFFAGAASALSFGMPIEDAVCIGTNMAAAVITTTENVCPAADPSEYGFQL